MGHLDKWIQLYIGCETNKGQLIGIVSDRLFIREPGKQAITDYHKQVLGKSLFLYLRKIRNAGIHDATVNVASFICGQKSRQEERKNDSVYNCYPQTILCKNRGDRLGARAAPRSLRSRKDKVTGTK